jgi:hypothetical protein
MVAVLLLIILVVFLTFPKFYLPVDDSSDCIIRGSNSLKDIPATFDS